LQRILEPGQIETLAQRSIPRIRLPDRARVFAARAERLRQLSDAHAFGDYLRLMALLVDAQQSALTRFSVTSPTTEEIAKAHLHRMPLLHADAQMRDNGWLDILKDVCAAIAATPHLPSAATASIDALRHAPTEHIEAQAAALLAARSTGIDAASAPFIMAALQVVWTSLASRLSPDDAAPLDVHGVCPVCATLPVASIIRTEKHYHGYRYLHCALCATEWHMVRVTCSQCEATKNIGYHAIEGASGAVRAESCDACRTYRKILYQEKDAHVEPVADDLASIALDLMMSEAGYHRGSGNPLLWQPSET
jgi:FdhE protein